MLKSLVVGVRVITQIAERDGLPKLDRCQRVAAPMYAGVDAMSETYVAREFV